MALWQVFAASCARGDDGDAFPSLVAVLDYWQAQLPINEGHEAKGYRKGGYEVFNHINFLRFFLFSVFAKLHGELPLGQSQAL